jgi:hypothetical protein
MGRPLTHYKKKKSLVDAFFTMGTIFLLFYVVSLSGLLALTAYVYTHFLIVSLLIFIGVIISIFPAIFEWQNKKYDEITRLVKQRVKAR